MITYLCRQLVLYTVYTEYLCRISITRTYFQFISSYPLYLTKFLHTTDNRIHLENLDEYRISLPSPGHVWTLSSETNQHSIRPQTTVKPWVLGPGLVAWVVKVPQESHRNFQPIIFPTWEYRHAYDNSTKLYQIIVMQYIEIPDGWDTISFNLISQCLLEGISTNPSKKIKNIQGLASYQCPTVLPFFKNVFWWCSSRFFLSPDKAGLDTYDPNLMYQRRRIHVLNIIYIYI